MVGAPAARDVVLERRGGSVEAVAVQLDRQRRSVAASGSRPLSLRGDAARRGSFVRRRACIGARGALAAPTLGGSRAIRRLTGRVTSAPTRAGAA